MPNALSQIRALLDSMLSLKKDSALCFISMKILKWACKRKRVPWWNRDKQLSSFVKWHRRGGGGKNNNSNQLWSRWRLIFFTELQYSVASDVSVPCNNEKQSARPGFWRKARNWRSWKLVFYCQLYVALSIDTHSPNIVVTSEGEDREIMNILNPEELPTY